MSQSDPDDQTTAQPGPDDQDAVAQARDDGVDGAERAGEDAADDGADESPDVRRDRRYRERLRDVEAQRDKLRDALLPHVRAAVEKVAAQRLTAGASIWLIPGLDPLQLVDEQFVVDPKRVKAVVDRLLKHAPQLGIQIPDMDMGARGSSSPRASWREVIGGR